MRFAIQADSLVGGKNYRHAGVGRYSYMIIDHLIRMGANHQWHILLNPAFEIPAEWLELPNCRFSRVGPKFRIWRGLIRTPYLLWHRIDALHVVSGPLCNHRMIRQAYTVHDLFPFDYPEVFPDDMIGRMQTMAEQQILRADLLFSVSQNTKDRVMQRYPQIPSDRIVVTPNGPGHVAGAVDRAAIAPERLRELGVPFARYFFTLGTLEPRKNLGALFEAMALVRKKPGCEDVGLCVAGGKGWKDSAVFSRVRELGLEDAIAFLGYVPDEDLPELFAAASATVCASIDEGFGIPVLEAMLYGSPVATSNRGALPEVGGDAVVYFDPMDVEEMSDALASMIDGRVDTEGLRSRGIARAQRFTWESTAKTTLAELEKLASRRT